MITEPTSSGAIAELELEKVSADGDSVLLLGIKLKNGTGLGRVDSDINLMISYENSQLKKRSQAFCREDPASLQGSSPRLCSQSTPL